jgi:hypothetical protein
MTEQLVYLTTLAMEVFILSIWYGVFANPVYPQANPGLSGTGQVVLLGAVAFSGYFLGKLPGIKRFPLLSRRLILAIWILLSLLISLKIAFYWQNSFNLLEMLIDTGININNNPTLDKFFHLIFVAVLTVRGIQMSQRPPLDPSSVQQSFQLGIGAILIFGLFYGTQFLTTNLLSLGGFLLFGLLALSLARLSGLYRLRGGRTARLNKRWIMAVILGTVIATTLALAAGWLGGGWIGVWISRIFQWFMASLFALLSFLLYPLFFFLEWLMPQLSDKLTGKSSKSPYQQTLETLDKIRQQWQDVYNPKVPQNTTMIWITIVLLLAIGVGSLLLLKWKPWKRQGTGQVDFESSAGRSSFKVLGNILQGNVGSGRKKSGLRQILAAARIYQVYARLLHHCDQLGLPKPPAWTPLEFLPKMQEYFPGGESDLALITSAFLKIRYGELPESPEEVQTVVNAWESIKKLPHKREVTPAPAGTVNPGV